MTMTTCLIAVLRVKHTFSFTCVVRVFIYHLFFSGSEIGFTLKTVSGNSAFRGECRVSGERAVSVC